EWDSARSRHGDRARGCAFGVYYPGRCLEERPARGAKRRVRGAVQLLPGAHRHAGAGAWRRDDLRLVGRAARTTDGEAALHGRPATQRPADAGLPREGVRPLAASAADLADRLLQPPPAGADAAGM